MPDYIDDIVENCRKDGYICASLGMDYDTISDGDILKLREIIKRMFKIACEYADECVNATLKCNKNYSQLCGLMMVYKEAEK